MNSLSPAERSFASSRQAVSAVTLQEESVHLGAIRGGGEQGGSRGGLSPHLSDSGDPSPTTRRRSERASTCARRPSGRD